MCVYRDPHSSEDLSTHTLKFSINQNPLLRIIIPYSKLIASPPLL